MFGANQFIFYHIHSKYKKRAFIYIYIYYEGYNLIGSNNKRDYFDIVYLG